MTPLFEKKDAWGTPAAIWVIAILVFLAPLAWWSVSKIRLENDVEGWLPDKDPELRVLRWSHEQFPVDERIFLTWKSSGLNDPRLAQLADELEGVVDAQGIKRVGLKEIDSVTRPIDVINRMRENGVDSQEAVQRLTGVILGAGPLRVQLAEGARPRLKRVESFLTEEFRREFGTELTIRQPSDRFAELVSLPSTDGIDDTELPPATLSVDGTLRDVSTLDHQLELEWRGLRMATDETDRVAKWLLALRGNERLGLADGPLVTDCFFVPGMPVALAVSLTEAGLAEKSETLEKVREAAAQCGISRDELAMGGSVVAGSELNAAVKRAGWDTRYPIWNLPRRSVILMSGLVGAVLGFLMVRSLRLSAMCQVVSIYAAFLATALVPATGGTMNMVLVVMPTLLLVLTLSGAIHVVNYWRHAVAENPSTAISTTVRTAWLPCTLASFTTAIGLASLCTSVLTPVRDFGFYAAVGTGISLLLVLFALPALLQIWPGRVQKLKEIDVESWRTYGRAVTRSPGLGALIALAICAIASFGLTRFETETKVIRYFPENSEVVKDYWFIENQLAGIVPVEVIVRFDESSQQETTLLDRMEVVRTIENKLRNHAEITGAISLADFLEVTERPAADAGFLANSRYNKRANTMQDRLRSGEFGGAASFYHWAEKGHDWLKTGDMALNRPGDELWRVTAQVNVMSDANYATIRSDLDNIARETLRLHAGASHVVTGTVPLFLRTQQAVLDSLIVSFGLAFVLILVVMAFMLRNPLAALIAMVPNILPVTVVFGAISYFDIRVDIGTMITASIALGIAVDGTLHFLTWFLLHIHRGETRREAVIHSLAHCGPAMWQTSLAVAAGLLVLLPAELLLISRFGWLMASMIAVALLADILLLPMLLAGPTGRLFERQPRRAAAAAESVSHPHGVVPSPHLKSTAMSTDLGVHR